MQNTVDKSLVKIITTLSDVSKEIKNFSLVNHKQNIILHTRLQTIFNLKFADKSEQAIFDIIINHAIAAEKMGPGGFDLFVENALELLKIYVMGYQTNITKDILWASLNEGAAVPTQSDVIWLMTSYFKNISNKIRSMLTQALMLAGSGGRIIVEKSQSVASVELIKGYTFDLVSIWPVNIVLERPKMICIDGFIESVADIHHFLQEASESKEPIVLFARGMSEEVKHTIKVNYDRGTLRVIPIIVNFDLDGINTLNDICVVSGCDLVSSTKGDLISSIRLKDLVNTERVVIYPTQIIITNTKTSLAVDHHLNFLLKKRESEKTVDINKLIDQRIRSLSTNYVVIRLPDDKDFVISSQHIDYVLRAFKSMIEHGTVIFKNNRTLTSAAVATKIHSEKCLDTIKNLGSVVT